MMPGIALSTSPRIWPGTVAAMDEVALLREKLALCL